MNLVKILVVFILFFNFKTLKACGETLTQIFPSIEELQNTKIYWRHRIPFSKTKNSDSPDDSALSRPLLELVEEKGLVTVRIDLKAEYLVEAYRKGIVPYYQLPNGKFAWFYFPKRGIVFLNRINLGSSSRSVIGKYRVTFDTAFEAVMRACKGALRQNPWISEVHIKAFNDLHKMGHAHSVEVWEGDKLVGGTYGVFIDGVFSGESMFYLKSNAGKLAFVYLAAYLKTRGIEWLDAQKLSPTMQSLGGELVEVSEYRKLVEASHARTFPGAERPILPFKDTDDTSDSMMSRVPSPDEIKKWLIENRRSMREVQP